MNYRSIGKLVTSTALLLICATLPALSQATGEDPAPIAEEQIDAEEEASAVEEEQAESPVVIPMESDCVYLEGVCVFTVTASPETIKSRIETIQNRLKAASLRYLTDETSALSVEASRRTDAADILVDGIRVVTVRAQDATDEEQTIEERAQEIRDSIRVTLAELKAERSISELSKRIALALGLIATTGIFVLWSRRYRAVLKDKLNEPFAEGINDEGVEDELLQVKRRQRWEILFRLLQTFEVALVIGCSLTVLGLFPFTRPLRVFLIRTFGLPVKLFGVALGTYVAIRLSYLALAACELMLSRQSFNSTIVDQRFGLRRATLVRVARSICAFVFTGLGLMAGLGVAGVNLIPILTGAGILGLGVSLASQNLLKDLLSGIFIVAEDQFGVGDIVSIGEVSGMVESFSLRSTRLRDRAGCAVTIPNGSIEVVKNHSADWARCDMLIPIPYSSNINEGLQLLTEVAFTMYREFQYHGVIIKEPEILGLDAYGPCGYDIRVWLTVAPLKQWEVSREYRKRIVLAYEQRGWAIPAEQLEVTHHSLAGLLPKEAATNRQEGLSERHMNQ